MVVVVKLELSLLAITKTDVPARSVVVMPVEIPAVSYSVEGPMNRTVAVPAAIAELA